ncbi:MAG: ribonuclease R [Caldimicrobium sp.]|nr:ribonuclease R [Caldimicrobium sp.]MCX7874085.1 ribonuclease R [Caldimicrobium sp.]MDW8093779.1 ribonuclease R [Caldimicrobium sp.]
MRKRAFKKDYLDEREVLKLFEKTKGTLLLREVYHLLNVPSVDREKVRELIKKLVSQGKLVQIKKRRYALLEKLSLKKGKLRVHPDGFGFVETESEETIFIPPRKLGQALDGDIVLVRVERLSKKGPEGRIISVLERPRKHFVGYLVKRNKFFFVEPEDRRLPFEIFIPKKRRHKAKEGHLVVAKILQPTSEFGVPLGEIVHDLGDPTNLESHTWATIFTKDLPHEFNDYIEKEITRLPEEVREEDKIGRVDLRDLPFVTIDGENARDFDDAICVKKHSEGYRLWVAIADVAHYVKKGSHLDKEAYLRGTSVYFPNLVLPMFPKKLSNHLCSLNPKVDRLAMVVEIDYTHTGKIRSQKFYEGVIKSQARLTYTEVKEILLDEKAQLLQKYKDLCSMLREAGELAQILREKRMERGSLDFDLPEPEIILNLEGKIENIVKRERNLAHMLIEDFMISANEAVAEFLSENNYPLLYRIHETPDLNKLKELLEFFPLEGIEIKIPEEPDPKFFQHLLELIRDHPLGYLYHHMLLRSLKQAKYSPENVGHFGLASPCYCHFTSPIRRFPDLVVHRILKKALRKKRAPYTAEELEIMGKHLSLRERIAEEAEREVLKKFQAFFMKDKVGQIFTGIISGLTAFGFFVDLEEYLVSGVVRLVDIPDDYYILDEKGTCLIGKKTGKTFQLGQRVKVKVKEVDLIRFQINFLLV